MSQITANASSPTTQYQEASDDALTHSLKTIAVAYHYNHWIFDTIRSFIGETVLEVGAGIGNITQFLLNAKRIVCIEPVDVFYQYLTTKFIDHRNVSVFPLAIEECIDSGIIGGECDTVLCVNVLEHLKDDVAALKRMRTMMRPGGRIVVFVPGMPQIYGKVDEALGHYRRYSVSTLKKAFADAGITPVHARYMNMCGAIGWWWHGCVRGCTRIPTSGARIFNKMVPILSALERLLPIMFGQSVYCVGK